MGKWGIKRIPNKYAYRLQFLFLIIYSFIIFYWGGVKIRTPPSQKTASAPEPSVERFHFIFI